MEETIESMQKDSASVNTGQLLLAKIAAMMVLGVGSLCVGALPLCVSRCRLNRGDTSTSKVIILNE